MTVHRQHSFSRGLVRKTYGVLGIGESRFVFVMQLWYAIIWEAAKPSWALS